MNLVETGSVAVADLPMAEFRAHLRMGTGFGEETLQDAVLEGFLRASLAGVGARISKSVLAKGYRLTVPVWSEGDAQLLPRAPVVSVDQVLMRDRVGTEESLDAELYHLSADQHFPKLQARGTALPVIAEGHVAVVDFTAGYPNWDAVPADLQQAVLLLAAHYYEYRNETALARGCMPFGVTSLLERFRPLRIGGGAV